MLSLGSSHSYYLYRAACDMRKSFDSLSGLVRNELGRDPASGEVFVFINKRRTSVKLLHWERGGFVLYYKRLEKGGRHPERLPCPVFLLLIVVMEAEAHYPGRNWC